MFGSKKERNATTPAPVQTAAGSDNTRILALIAQDYLKDRRSRRRWGLFFKLLVLAYISVTTTFYFLDSDHTVTARHSAIVEIEGVVGPGEISAEMINKSLRNAFNADAAEGVIIKINSPGGTPVQAAMINQEILRLKSLYPDKKVYAAVSDMCASGGYYIAVAADEIYAHPSSIVGSIGVLMNGFGFVETLRKLGIERRLLVAGSNKAMLDPFSPEDPVQTSHAQRMLDEVHQQFIDAVKAGRGDRISPNPDIYSGLFWSGEKAMQLGLIDEYGSAELIARDVIGADRMIDYTVRPDFFDTFARQLGSSIGNVFLKSNFRLQ